MAPKELILVTGASGFIGAQVVEHLLNAGYAVRGTSRSTKAELLQKNCDHPNFEVAVMDDLIGGDFSGALKGVKAVIHLASPLASGSNHIEVAVNGTLNILRQAHAGNVYKVIIVSSLAATTTSIETLFDSTRTLNDDNWNTITKEEALRPGANPFFVYAASKALAERAAWAFADTHPQMDLMTLLPAYVYGPIAKSQVIARPGQGLSTNRFIYLLISGAAAAYPPVMPPQYVDVRDVAKACVRSLKAPPTEASEKRRILLGGGSFTWKQAANHIGVARPMLKPRLVDRGEAVAEEIPSASIDSTKAEEVLGISEFIGWRQSVEDAVDSLLGREYVWAGN